MVEYVTGTNLDKESANDEVMNANVPNQLDASVQVGDTLCDLKTKIERLEKEKDDLLEKVRTYESLVVNEAEAARELLEQQREDLRQQQVTEQIQEMLRSQEEYQKYQKRLELQKAAASQ